MHCVYANIFGAIVFILRFKIDAVVIVIRSIVIIINSVFTLQVSTASLPHDRKPCEIKVVSNHTCSLHTCVCPGSRRVRRCLCGFWQQGISSTPGGFLKCPIPVRVCAEQPTTAMFSWWFLQTYLTSGPYSFWFFLVMKQRIFKKYLGLQVMAILCWVAKNSLRGTMPYLS